MKFTRLIVAAALLAIIGTSCKPNEQEREATRRADDAKRESREISEFASRHNAYTDWAAAIPERGPGNIFTLDLAKALVRTNGQPVLIEMELVDMAEKGGVTTACFTLEGVTNSPVLTLRLILRCTEQQTEQLLHAKSGQPFGPPSFAIVARIDSVSRPALEVVSSGTDDKYDFNVDPLPDVFFANGECVDVLPIKGTSFAQRFGGNRSGAGKL